MCNPSSSPLLNILFELLCFCFHTYSLFIGYQTQMCERLRWLNLVCQVKKIHPNIRRKTTARAFILESLRSALCFSLEMPHFKKPRLVLHPQLCLWLCNRMEQDAKWTVTEATECRMPMDSNRRFWIQDSMEHWACSPVRQKIRTALGKI